MEKLNPTNLMVIYFCIYLGMTISKYSIHGTSGYGEIPNGWFISGKSPLETMRFSDLEWDFWKQIQVGV